MIIIEHRCYNREMYKGKAPNLARNDERRSPGEGDTESQSVH